MNLCYFEIDINMHAAWSVLKCVHVSIGDLWNWSLIEWNNVWVRENTYFTCSYRIQNQSANIIACKSTWKGQEWLCVVDRFAGRTSSFVCDSSLYIYIYILRERKTHSWFHIKPKIHTRRVYNAHSVGWLAIQVPSVGRFRNAKPNPAAGTTPKYYFAQCINNHTHTRTQYVWIFICDAANAVVTRIRAIFSRMWWPSSSSQEHRMMIHCWWCG